NLGLAYLYGYPSNFSEYLDSVNFMMFHGGTLTYFIIIIFQFYALHILFAKYLVKFNPFKIIVISLIITTLYWAMRTFIDEPQTMLFSWMWQREGWMVFIGWLSYFMLGFYTGYYYESFMANIQRYNKHIVIGACIVAFLTIVN